MTPLVFVVVVSWNHASDVVECLESLRQLDYPNYRVVVVDNGSTDETVAVVRERFAEVHLIENRENLGYAEGNNVGIRYALENGAEYIFILNDDTIVTPEVITHLVQVGDRNPEVGMLGPSVISYANPSLQYLGSRINWTTGNPIYAPITEVEIRDAEYLTGCALMVKSRVVREIGLLDPRYFCYFEDADWGIRCWRARYRCVTVPHAQIFHKGTPDSRRFLSVHSSYYYWRNQYLFMRHYVHGYKWLIFLCYYTYQTGRAINTLMCQNMVDHANALIAGFWSGFTCKVGPTREDAPAWFKAVMFRMAPIIVRSAYLTKALWPQSRGKR